jgi:hypothetical protein
VDDKRLANQAMRGKGFIYLCLIVLIIILILIISIFVIIKTAHSTYLNRELSSSVTVESAENALRGEDILVKTSDAYYELDGNDNFLGLFGLDKWTLCDKFSDDDVHLILHFSEEYEMYFYDNGKASFYDGYSTSDTNPEAYYEVPADILNNIIEYITENGTTREMGDGKIGLSTFLK